MGSAQFTDPMDIIPIEYSPIPISRDHQMLSEPLRYLQLPIIANSGNKEPPMSGGIPQGLSLARDVVPTSLTSLVTKSMRVHKECMHNRLRDIVYEYLGWPLTVPMGTNILIIIIKTPLREGVAWKYTADHQISMILNDSPLHYA
jgi:hypothetical protein